MEILKTQYVKRGKYKKYMSSFLYDNSTSFEHLDIIVAQ